MRNFLFGLKIRVKLLIAFGSILLLSVLLIFFSVTSINTILRHKAINEEVDRLKLYQETLDLSAKEFLYEGYKMDEFLKDKQSPSVTTFQQSYDQSRTIITDIKQSNLTKDDKALTESLLATLDSLNADFNQLVMHLEKRGFRDYGSEGALRTAIHQVENSGFNIDKVALLTLRRHEKDFFLRKDLRYRDEFNTRIAAFRSQLESDPPLAGLIPSLDNYSREFNYVVDIETQIGLKDRDGLRGKIRSHFETIRPKLDSFRERIRATNETEIFRTKLVLGFLFLAQIITGLIMAIVYANLLTKSIKEIRNGIQQLAGGNFPDKLAVKTSEEIGQTKIAFNQFIDRLKAATTFASRLGTDDEDLHYDQKFADDVLAVSLTRAHNKLMDANTRQTKINWANQGLAAFNDILKNDSADITTLADKITSQLVKTVRANQGALYLVTKENDKAYLKRVATYAYGKKKYEQHQLDIGEGIVGQSVLEGSTIYLKDIPRDFVKITSGLGEATPRNVMVVPLKIQLQVMGVIELASFHLFHAHEIEFVERIAENIATMLSGKQAAIETKHLLEESLRRANALAQQEEEMRQNAEELEATQEEMERQRQSMERQIASLKQELAVAKQRLADKAYSDPLLQ